MTIGIIYSPIEVALFYLSDVLCVLNRLKHFGKISSKSVDWFRSYVKVNSVQNITLFLDDIKT